jgi:hypothetical protein
VAAEVYENYRYQWITFDHASAEGFPWTVRMTDYDSLRWESQHALYTSHLPPSAIDATRAGAAFVIQAGLCDQCNTVILQTVLLGSRNHPNDIILYP